MQTSNQNPTSSFRPNLSPFFFKTKENKKPSATKNGNFLDLRQAKVTQASEPESGELNSDDAPAKPLAFDSDSLESIGCIPRHTFKAGLSFRHCTKKEKEKKYA
jgi:hypothetical protein